MVIRFVFLSLALVFCVTTHSSSRNKQFFFGHNSLFGGKTGGMNSLDCKGETCLDWAVLFGSARGVQEALKNKAGFAKSVLNSSLEQAISSLESETDKSSLLRRKEIVDLIQAALRKKEAALIDKRLQKESRNILAAYNLFLGKNKYMPGDSKFIIARHAFAYGAGSLAGRDSAVVTSPEAVGAGAGSSIGTVGGPVKSYKKAAIMRRNKRGRGQAVVVPTATAQSESEVDYEILQIKSSSLFGCCSRGK